MLTRVDRYILRQVLYGTLFALLVLCLVFVLGNVFKEIRPYLVEKGLGLLFIGKFMLHLLPLAFVYIIPWAFLAAVLIVFGRLSSDQEITSMRSAGLSLYRIAFPVLVLGLLLSGVCLWLNGIKAPRSKASLKQMIFEETLDDPTRFFEPGVVQASLRGESVYIEDRTDDDSLRGFHIYSLRDDDQLEGYVYSKKVDFEINKEERRFKLRLSNYLSELYRTDGSIAITRSDMVEPYIQSYNQQKSQHVKPDQLDNLQIIEAIKDPAKYGVPDKYIAELPFEHIRRYPFSFSPLALAFIAIPLSLQSRRKETSSGLVLTVLIAFFYFMLIAVAKELHGDNLLLSILAVWLPNLLCLGLGLMLFNKASKQS